MPSLANESIKRREVLFCNVKGLIEFPGWALTVTSLGAMFEPFNAGVRLDWNASKLNFDPSEPLCRIDAMRGLPMESIDVIHYDEESPIHGGVLHPREFAKAGTFTV